MLPADEAVPNGAAPRRVPHLFLSHAGVDSAAARQLTDKIHADPEARAAGLTVWFDRDPKHKNLQPGANWINVIGRAIDSESTAFAVYVGSSGIINWVERETNLALSRATTDHDYLFIPILAPGSRGSSWLPPFVRQHQSVVDPLGNDAAFRALVSALIAPAGSGEVPPIPDARPAEPPPPPFVGLRAMTEQDADRFYGRDEEVGEVLALMRRFRLVAISAESGSGKSSLAQAGIISKFRGGALEPDDRLQPEGRVRHVVVMRPLSDPVEGLRLAITRAAQDYGQSGAEKDNLRRRVDLDKPEDTAFAIQCDLDVDKTETLIVVDQLEELRTSPATVQIAFFRLLQTLAGKPGDNGFRVLITVREDYRDLFLGPDMLGPSLTGDRRQALYNLERISDDPGLVDAITKPLKRAGVADDAQIKSLVTLFQQDTRRRPGDLALVQMALFVVWQRRGEFNGNLVDTYLGVGGVSGALAKEAERVRDKLPADEQKLLFSIFVRLVRLDTTGGVTRRTAKLDEFGLAGSPRRVLIDKLVSDDFGRLLMLVEGGSVDLSHESLITRWAWLNNELNASNVVREMRRLGRMMDRAEPWSGSWWKTAELATGNELDGFRELKKTRPGWLSKSEQDYVDASQWARVVTATGAVAAVVLFLGTAAWLLLAWQISNATAEVEIGRQKQAAAAAQMQAESAQKQADAAQAEADRSLNEAIRLGQVVSINLADAVALQGDRLRGLALASDVARFTKVPDNKRTAAVVLYRILTERLPTAVLDGSVIGFADGLLRLSRVENGKTIIRQYELATNKLTAVAEADQVFANCNFAICYGDDGILDLATRKLHTLPAGMSVLAASPVGTDFVFAPFPTAKEMREHLNDSGVELFSGGLDATPTSIGTFSSDPEWDPINAEWSPNGDSVGVMGLAQAVVLKTRAATGRQIDVGEGYSPLFMRFSPDGAHIATSSGDFPAVRVWSSTSGKPINLDSGTREARDVVFSSTGDTIVTGDGVGNVRLFSVRSGDLLAQLGNRPWAVVDLDFDRSSQLVCALWADGVAIAWDARTRSIVDGPLMAHAGRADHLVCQDGRLFLSGVQSGTEVWNIGAASETAAMTVTPVPNAGEDLALEFTPEGRAVITLGGATESCRERWVSGSGRADCESVTTISSPDENMLPDLQPADDVTAVARDGLLCAPVADPVPDGYVAACIPQLEPDETVIKTQVGNETGTPSALATSGNRLILFDGTTGGLITSVQFTSADADLSAVVSVRYDGSADKLFLFRGVDAVEMWDTRTAERLLQVPTDYTFFGLPVAVADVYIAHHVLAAFHDDTLYEYRYFAADDDMVSLATAKLDSLKPQ